MQKGSNDWKENQLTVALRVRPLAKDERDTGATNIAQTVDDQVVVLMDPTNDSRDGLRPRRSREKHCCFDYVFGPQCPQEEVYSKTTKVLINSVTMGFNATVFAYGATGAGKTYTMLGTDREPGIMARALQDLFQEMDQTREHTVYKATMSYLEIYNEMIRDLLNPSSGYLDLREHASGVVQVAGISEVSTNSSTEVMNLLTRGNKERTQEPTAANKTSSRSHAVLQVTVRQKDRVRGLNQNVRTGKLFLIDLAGSERASQTKNRGKRMIEGAHINRSLLALGNCINALCEGAGKYVNYRDSKLTRLLKDSLGGNCKTVMIANISPSSVFFEESRNTLIYADRAKKIKMKIKPHTNNVSAHMAQYGNIISELRHEIKRLQQKISSHEEEERETAIGGAASHREMDLLRQQLMSNFNAQMGIRQDLMDVEQQTWRLSMDANKQLALIAEWEQEQLRLHSKNKPKITLTFKDLDNRLKDGERDLDTKSITSESPEPEEISTARQQLSKILRQRADCHSKKSDLEESLKNIRNNGSLLEENLPNKTTSDEQREILSMLCKVHELEIENTELKSKALYNSNELQVKESNYMKMTRQRELCDQIISQQKELLEENHILYDQELEELFEMYDVIVREGVPPWDSRINLPHIDKRKASLIIPTEGEKDQESEKLLELKNSFKVLSTKDTGQEEVEDSSRVFMPSPRGWRLQHQMTRPPSIILPVRLESSNLTRHGSLTSLGITRSRVRSPASVSLQLPPHTPRPQGRRDERRKMKNQTKSIAAKAARKKTTTVGHSDRRLALEKTPTFLHSLEEATDVESGVESEIDRLTNSRLLQHHQRTITQNSRIAESRRLSESEEVETVSVDGGSVGNAEKKAEGGGMDKRVNYRGGVKKIHITNRQVMQQKMKKGADNEQRKHPTLAKSSAGEGKLTSKKPKPMVVNGEIIRQTRLKYPSNHSSGAAHRLVPLDSSPLATVHQLGVDKGRGHTVQRRLRGPTTNASSIGPHRTQGSKAGGIPVPSRGQPGLLQISGHTAPRRGSGGRKL